LEAGNWKLETGSWKLEAGSWKLEASNQLSGSKMPESDDWLISVRVQICRGAARGAGQQIRGDEILEVQPCEGILLGIVERTPPQCHCGVAQQAVTAGGATVRMG
jgi:hypothetical protein